MTLDEVAATSNLVQDPAYQRLVNQLAGELSAIEEKLSAFGNTRDEDERLLPLWKALRKVVLKLKTAPIEATKLLDECLQKNPDLSLDGLTGTVEIE